MEPKSNTALRTGISFRIEQEWTGYWRQLSQTLALNAVRFAFKLRIAYEYKLPRQGTKAPCGDLPAVSYNGSPKPVRYPWVCPTCELTVLALVRPRTIVTHHPRGMPPPSPTRRWDRVADYDTCNGRLTCLNLSHTFSSC